MSKLHPYYVKLRGTGKRSGDWDTGLETKFVNRNKGGEVYIGTEGQGAVILRVGRDRDGSIRARLMTAKHRWPPKTGRLYGTDTVVGDFYVKTGQPVPSDKQLSLFGVGRDICSACGQAILLVETKAGLAIRLDAEPETRWEISSSGKAAASVVYSRHECTKERD
jgi:hypothetical protein